MKTAITIKPNSKPQVDFFAAKEYEILYGGSAGGGKSWSLVVDPMRYIDYPQFTAIIFRRTYPELEGSIIPLTHHYYQNAGAVWNEQKKVYTFPSGAKIKLGFMQYLDDWRNHQGSEYCGQYYDELTNFEWEQYTMLAAWNRSKVDGIEPYRRAASNPGGPGHKKVKDYFVDTCPPVPDGPMVYSELARMWYQPMKSGPTYRHMNELDQVLTRKFIPARVFDNVDMLKRNPNYVAQLLQLPERKRKGLLEGDWNLFEGQFFDEFNSDIHILGPKQYQPYEVILNNYSVLGGLDYGKITAAEFIAKDSSDNIIIFDELSHENINRTQKIADMKKFLRDRHMSKIRVVADTNMWIPDSFDVAFSNIPANDYILNGNVNLIKVSKRSSENRNYRIACNDAMKDLLHYELVEDNKEAFKIKPRIKIYSRCKKLIETLPTLIVSETDQEDIEDSDYDHYYDAFKMPMMMLYKPREIDLDNRMQWQVKLANNCKKNKKLGAVSYMGQ